MFYSNALNQTLSESVFYVLIVYIVGKEEPFKLVLSVSYAANVVQVNSIFLLVQQSYFKPKYFIQKRYIYSNCYSVFKRYIQY